MGITTETQRGGGKQISVTLRLCGSSQCCPYEIADIFELLKVPAHLNDAIGNRSRLIPELVLELPIRERPLHIPERALDEAIKRLAVLEFDCDVRLVFRDRGIPDRNNALPNTRKNRITGSSIREFLDSRL